MPLKQSSAKTRVSQHDTQSVQDAILKPPIIPQIKKNQNANEERQSTTPTEMNQTLELSADHFLKSYPKNASMMDYKLS